MPLHRKSSDRCNLCCLKPDGRVEFLKGPAAALYGSSEPGGTYNVVTKKPRFTAARRAGLQVGTLGFARATLDATGPLTQNLAYRINLAAEDGTSRSKLIDSKKIVIAPALTWVIDADTVFNYESEFLRLPTQIGRASCRERV